jgi:hypothetical protein
MLNNLKSVADFNENRSERVCVIDEKFYAIELIAPAELGEKLSCRLFICGRVETHMKDLVCLWINGAAQSKLLAVEAHHLFVSCELILGGGRDRL